VTAAALVSSQTAQACTGILLTAADGTVVHARTLEFAIDLKSDVILVPRGYARTGTTPDGKPGKSWTAKYASLGANGLGLAVLFDGLNEKGLSAGLFYFPNMAALLAHDVAASYIFPVLSGEGRHEGRGVPDACWSAGCVV
jgi:choloylglycine hydrolase